MKVVLKCIADWHGEQAANFYMRWSRDGKDPDLRDYVRHAGIAERMWAEQSSRRGE